MEKRRREKGKGKRAEAAVYAEAHITIDTDTIICIETQRRGKNARTHTLGERGVGNLLV